MRTVRAPTTALSGKNISEDSLAISRAILAAPYAVLQPDSFDDPASSAPVSEGSQSGESMDKAIELDEGASAIGYLVLGCTLETSFFVNPFGNVGLPGGGLFVAGDDDFRRKWCMVDDRTTTCGCHLFQCHSHRWNLAF